MGGLFVTSDLHFRHLKLAQMRGFARPEEHDEALIEAWNRRVPRDSVVWVLGDVGMGPSKLFLPLVARLNGELHLVSGNHDEVWPGHRDAHLFQRRWLEVFASAQPFARWRRGGRTFLLSHFPYGSDHTEIARHTQWRLRDEGEWLVHGHVHSQDKGSGREIHVGWDAWGAPVPAEEIDRVAAAREAESAGEAA